MKEAFKEIGHMVREHRERKNLTQYELAKMLGYESTQFISIFERGLSKVPVQTLGKLIVILQISEKKILKILVDAYRNELENELEAGKKGIHAKAST